MQIKNTLVAVLAGLGLAAAVTAISPNRASAPEADPTAPPVASAEAVWDLLLARPFRVGEPFTHWWRAERPQVSAGHLLVLAVDPARFVPRQELEPVLQVGDQTAERVNSGHIDGVLVVIVPSVAGEDGWPTRDLSQDPIFLGSLALPEEVGAAHLLAELGATSALSFGPQRVAQALAHGGAPLDAIDRVELEQEAARLILAYAPGERDKAEGLLVPFQR